MRRFLKPLSSSGVAAVEFAIMAPFLLVLIASVIELGLATRDALRAQAAAAAGAFYAMAHGFDAAKISAAVTNGTGASGITASPAPVQTCGCPTATGITAKGCTATCPDGRMSRKYATVSAAITRTTIIDANLGLPTTLTRQSIARLP